MKHLALSLALCAVAPALSAQRSGTAPAGGMDLVAVSNGFGLMLPHRVLELDALGNPTGSVVSIRTPRELFANVRSTNPILAVVNWPTGPVLPNGSTGNHFVAARFTQPIELDSVLNPLASGAASSHLAGTISVQTVDPATGAVGTVTGRAFIGGKTVAGALPGTSTLGIQQWIGVDANGKPIALDVGGSQPGFGFPGTEDPVGFAGANLLVQDDIFVFVADADGDLSTHETFPSGVQLQLRIAPGVQALNGEVSRRRAVASSTVGTDALGPEIALSGSTLLPKITPAPGQIDVDPQTDITVELTEPVQPFSVGPSPGPGFPSLSGAFQIAFGASAGSPVQVPFTASPFSVYDLTRYRLEPLFDFPGAGPPSMPCSILNQVDVQLFAGALRDLSANANTFNAASSFQTGAGPGLVNAPVTPDAIYVARGGASGSLSVIDLNGFGAGTGNPTYDPSNPILKGNSNYPNNPNLLQASSLVPPLAPQGSCTFDGGSEGVFTLTKDSNLDSRLLGPPLVQSVGDMALGGALDRTFNNAPPPLGCQAGGGNLCASSSLKVVVPLALGPNTVVPGGVGSGGGPVPTVVPGAGNLASWAPHPNPPPLVFPQLCASPPIGGAEPTSVDSAVLGGGGPLANLLGPNPNFLGVPALGLPPAGLPTPEQNAFFEGVSPPQISVSSCSTYQVRQQIGFFLYVVDRVAGEVVILNSNRFTVLDRIELPDPTSLAMSPDLDFLAVANRNDGTVSFLDTDPSSSTFHQVVKTTAVGRAPAGLAWDPASEDLLVCNEGSDSVSIVSAFDFEVRKTLTGLAAPFDVAVTQRQAGFGLERNVYFAFILNRDGSLALFESGPNGVNGWGFDDIVGVAPFTLSSPTRIVLDPIELDGGCWILHEGPLDPATAQPVGSPTDPAVTNVVLESSVLGQIPLGQLAGTRPVLRDLEFGVRASIGPDQLTGKPTDIAFDNLTNLAGLPNVPSPFSAGQPAQTNGKSQVKLANGSFVNANEWSFLFLSVPNSDPATSGHFGGVVDVLTRNLQRIDTDPFENGVQSISAPGVSALMDYFRQ